MTAILTMRYDRIVEARPSDWKVSIGLMFVGVFCIQASDAPPRMTAGSSNSAVAAGSTTSATQAQPSGLKQDRANPRYQLCNGDTLEIVFPITPEFNQTVMVQPDGYVVLSGAGDVSVVGKTVPEVQGLVRQAYAKILHEPIVNIVMKDFVKPYFIAGGEVAKPGKYEMRDDTTLTQAIAMAGGFTESSKHSQVLLFRRVSGEWVTVKQLDVKNMYQTANLNEDLHLLPGDMFFVPQNNISKVKKWIPMPSMTVPVAPW